MSRIISLVYGPKTITDPKILDSVKDAIDSGNVFQVTNDTMGGDPQPGIVKIGTIEYIKPSLGLFPPVIQERSVIENGFWFFDWTVVWVAYGAGQSWGNYTNAPGVYKAIYDYHRDKSCFTVSNAFFGGDPAIGQVKTALIIVSTGGKLIQLTAQEGQQLCP